MIIILVFAADVTDCLISCFFCCCFLLHESDEVSYKYRFFY